MPDPRPPTPDAGPGARFDLTVVQPAAVHGEVVVSVARVVFCGLVLLRFFLVDELNRSVLALWLTWGTVVGCLVMSVVAVALARRGRMPNQWIVCSPLLDALFCFLLLLPNVLWVAPQNTGLLHTQELAVFLLVAFAAGFRLLPKAVVLGGFASFSSAIVLIGLDVSAGNTSLDAKFADILQYLVVLTGCVALAIVTAMRARKLALVAAKGARRSERAQHGLESLMQEHHDVRAVLSAAAINSSMVLRELIANSRAPGELKEVARDLREDLREASRAIHRVKQQAYAELTTLTDMVVVDVRRALGRVVAATRRRFHGVQITCEPGPETVAAVIGGADGLERMVANLLNNACEGDGTSTATRVDVSVEVGTIDVTITVADNGPGFPPIALTESRAGYPTTKPDGSGLGLLMVEGLVRASGGRLDKSNGASGARVQLVLLQQLPEEPHS